MLLSPEAVPLQELSKGDVISTVEEHRNDTAVNSKAKNIKFATNINITEF